MTGSLHLPRAAAPWPGGMWMVAVAGTLSLSPAYAAPWPAAASCPGNVTRCSMLGTLRPSPADAAPWPGCR